MPLDPTPTTPPALPHEDDLRADYLPLGKPLTLLNIAEGTLKSPSRMLHELHHGAARRVIGLQLLLAVLCLLAFGVTVGTFSLGSQLWLAPLKITLGVLFSALICLPSLFVFSCLAGADSEPGKILGALAGMLAVASLLLLAFGPVSWIFSQSTQSAIFMGMLNLAFWAIALAYGLQYLRRAVSLLNGHGGSHLAMWSIIFILVSLQMTATLRPIIGRSEGPLQAEKKFFLTHWNEALDQASRAPRR